MTKYRIGYLSDGFSNGDLRDFLPVYFTAYDKNRFSVYGYHTGRVDEVTAMFREAADGWHDMEGRTAAEIAGAIRADGIDILVQLMRRDLPLFAAVRAAKSAPIVVFEPEGAFCYSPFEKVLEYAVCAPCLERGALKAAYLDGKAAGEIDYDALDFGLCRHAPTLVALCRAADHSVPVVVCDEAGSPALARTMEALGMGGLYTREERDFAAAALRLSEDFEEIAHYHRRLHWRLHRSAIMDAAAFMIDTERAYSRLLAKREKRTRKSLETSLSAAGKTRDWNAFLAAFHALDGKGRIPRNKRLMAAWAYFFLHDFLRCLFWAREAERCGEEKPITQCYLQNHALIRAKRWQETYAVSQKALALAAQGEPMSKDIRFAVMMNLGSASYRLGKPETTQAYMEAYRLATHEVDICSFYSSVLMSYNFQDVPPKKVYERHLTYNDLFRQIRPYTHEAHKRKEKLRIGYISPDFRAHVMASFCWPFLATFDRDSFSVYAYSLALGDPYTDTFHSLVTVWRDVHEKTYAEIARQIHADEIDILVDLAGHTMGSGLPVLAYKPAPVQVSGLGYMTTTGLRTVDYFWTDSFVDPVGQGDAYFSEHLVRLTSQFCYNGQTNLPASAGTPAKARGYILFASFNQYTKITDELLADWARILAAVPRSRLLIKTEVFADIPTVETAYRRFETAGLPMDRVLFEPPSQDYMYRYLDVDIALDTYPYPGGGTTCDALYMGVPVVTRYREDRHSTRFSYGILSVIGLPELSSASREGYVEKAIALARDGELLDALHQNLRTMMQGSPLMDAQGYIDEVEAKYRMMWKRYEEGQHG
ncbi:hypothetical protein [uncultured Mitsuokella sp.]|uniref:O-linked N-acetylglucosamine transferase family protein n=1 Tax=uncultured Mitsuokella sp. TaxID=453120 RepID=UPI002614EAFF|nr:hypothetical protein [uncultured Mitsuokella sp.]